MFKRILVPLDGSERAESAIPVATRIARAYGASITLLRISEAPVEYGPYLARPASYSREMIEADLAVLKDYLETVAQTEAFAGLNVEVKALFGAVAPTLIAAAEAYQSSLIVMCSHGYTGFKRWLLGSVADKITRHAPVPVLIVREGAVLPAITPQQPVRALVALDGSPLSEAVFEPVAYLVAGLAFSTSHRGELHLLRVTDLPYGVGKARGQTHIDSMTRDEAVLAAREYLKSLVARLDEGGLANLDITVKTAVESDPDVAEAIITQAEGRSVDLIAMATHGRGGIQHFVMGSITERVLHHSKLPMLIVRPTREQAAMEQIKEAPGTGTEVDMQSWVGLL